jgi:predicted PolB exonuclease-like 3'-5' exonuclease
MVIQHKNKNGNGLNCHIMAPGSKRYELKKATIDTNDQTLNERKTRFQSTLALDVIIVTNF